jgi:hypothetical protein
LPAVVSVILTFEGLGCEVLLSIFDAAVGAP